MNEDLETFEFKEIKTKQLLYNFYYELKSKLLGKEIEIDKEEYEQKIYNSNITVLINYIREIIDIIIVEKTKEKINSYIENSDNKINNSKNEYDLLENYVKKLEFDIRHFMSNELHNSVVKDSLEFKIKCLSNIQSKYEELKEKVKFEEGYFLKNDRKENEILILHEENSILKNEIQKIKTLNIELNLVVEKYKEEITLLNEKIKTLENDIDSLNKEKEKFNKNNINNNNPSKFLDNNNSSAKGIIKNEHDKTSNQLNNHLINNKNNNIIMIHSNNINNKLNNPNINTNSPGCTANTNFNTNSTNNISNNNQIKINLQNQNANKLNGSQLKKGKQILGNFYWKHQMNRNNNIKYLEKFSSFMSMNNILSNNKSNNNKNNLLSNQKIKAKNESIKLKNISISSVPNLHKKSNKLRHNNSASLKTYKSKSCLSTEGYDFKQILAYTTNKFHKFNPKNSRNSSFKKCNKQKKSRISSLSMRIDNEERSVIISKLLTTNIMKDKQKLKNTKYANILNFIPGTQKLNLKGVKRRKDHKNICLITDKEKKLGSLTSRRNYSNHSLINFYIGRTKDI